MNKTELIQFLFTEWRKEEFISLLGNRSLYVTCKAECVKITTNSIENVGELSCSHEEADTRMLFHAKHASENGFTSIVVITPDTDVAIICMPFSHQMSATLCQDWKRK